MADSDFRIRSCRLKTDSMLGESIQLLADDAGPGLHVTLVMGGNGTGKSWLLAGLIESIMERGASTAYRKPSKGPFICDEVKMARGQTHGAPSRILALSSLVRDRFPFVPKGRGDGFYKYLGVRQATNLTTTGALDSSVSEAVLQIATDQTKLQKLQNWLSLFFPGAELAIGFPTTTRAVLDSYFANGGEALSRIEYMLKRWRGAARPHTYSQAELVALADNVEEVFSFLSASLREQESRRLPKRFPILRFRDEKHSVEAFAKLLNELPKIKAELPYARPTLLIRLNDWISFDQLSSGEQNLLSVGSKLLAFAKPSSLIVIDEPEVSLNTAWQQRYLDLIKSSLEHAPGSHVLIATHSPHFVGGLREGEGTIVLVRRKEGALRFETRPAAYEAWGAEAVLYEVLDIPSASTFAFNTELMRVLQHIQGNGRDRTLIQGFLDKTKHLKFSDTEALGLLIKDIEAYMGELG